MFSRFKKDACILVFRKAFEVSYYVYSLSTAFKFPLENSLTCGVLSSLVKRVKFNEEGMLGTDAS